MNLDKFIGWVYYGSLPILSKLQGQGLYISDIITCVLKLIQTQVMLDIEEIRNLPPWFALIMVETSSHGIAKSKMLSPSTKFEYTVISKITFEMMLL